MHPVHVRRFLTLMAALAAALALMLGAIAVLASDAEAWRASKARAVQIAKGQQARNCGNGSWWHRCVKPHTTSGYNPYCYRVGAHSWYCDGSVTEANRVGFHRNCFFRTHVYHDGALRVRKSC